MLCKALLLFVGSLAAVASAAPTFATDGQRSQSKPCHALVPGQPPPIPPHAQCIFYASGDCTGVPHLLSGGSSHLEAFRSYSCFTHNALGEGTDAVDAVQGPGIQGEAGDPVPNNGEAAIVTRGESQDPLWWMPGYVALFPKYDYQGEGSYVSALGNCQPFLANVAMKGLSLQQPKGATCRFYGGGECKESNTVATFDAMKEMLFMPSMGEYENKIGAVYCKTPDWGQFPGTSDIAGRADGDSALARRDPLGDIPPGFVAMWHLYNFEGPFSLVYALNKCTPFTPGTAMKGQSLFQSKGSHCRYYQTNVCNDHTYVHTYDSMANIVAMATIDKYELWFGSVWCVIPGQADAMEGPGIEGTAVDSVPENGDDSASSPDNIVNSSIIEEIWNRVFFISNTGNARGLQDKF